MEGDSGPTAVVERTERMLLEDEDAFSAGFDVVAESGEGSSGWMEAASVSCAAHDCRRWMDASAMSSLTVLNVKSTRQLTKSTKAELACSKWCVKIDASNEKACETISRVFSDDALRCALEVIFLCWSK